MHGRERRLVIVRPALSATTATSATLTNADKGAVGANTSATSRSVRRNAGGSSVRRSMRRSTRRTTRYGECGLSLALYVLYEP